MTDFVQTETQTRFRTDQPADRAGGNGQYAQGGQDKAAQQAFFLRFGGAGCCSDGVEVFAVSVMIFFCLLFSDGLKWLRPSERMDGEYVFKTSAQADVPADFLS